ncbi:hypothetical protein PV08_03411 [Exophiala spinifera]|uniref:3-phytase n=1 Tax=Exophiala spinifera TaxID=91928 RepID=A0A0D2C6D0_9EURO|nr:uncharacterized protein PV08_03411 [Exophiala spinifera]KIW19119.1 hypothetical protein PV08_03411 [Exophiala spinifera]
MPISFQIVVVSALLQVVADAGPPFGEMQPSIGGATFPPLLGGSSPWFPGPNVNQISADTPAGCTVDMAAFISRHGSRYPDPGAYSDWQELYWKIQNVTTPFEADEQLAFVKEWQPVFTHPQQQISQISPGGYKELYDMGVAYRWRYPQLYSDGEAFVAWANRYQANQPRVIDSARLFTRGFVGPNATTLGTVYVLNNTDPRSLGNSLAPSDLCPAYEDDSGGAFATTWANIYLPQIAERINNLTTPPGALNFTKDDVAVFATLCGYETQITGRTSPWCSVLSEDELEQYEYAQDIRYYYGSGPGALKNNTFMLPFLEAVVARFQDGPSKVYVSSDTSNGSATSSTFSPPRLIAAFTNDGQINQLASLIGVFDDQEPLPATHIPPQRRYIASHYTTMRGTISFERLTCSNNGQYIQILLNDAVYPVVGCDAGPGRSCPLSQYAGIVATKQAAAGSFVETCFGNASIAETSEPVKTTFLMDVELPFVEAVAP